MKKRLILVVQILLIVVIALSSYKIYKYYQANRNIKDINVEFEKIVNESVDSINNKANDQYEKGNDSDEINNDKESKDIESKRLINDLKEKYPDVVARILISGTEINQPIVQSNDNQFYLNHNFKNEYNPFGAVFMDYRNKNDFTDFNTVLYGHNVKTGHIFYELKKFLDPKFAEENNTIHLDTINGIKEYEIIAAYVADPYDKYRCPNYNEDELSIFIKYVKSKNKLNTSFPDGDFKILTLSTCSEGDQRMVVHAIEIK